MDKDVVPELLDEIKTEFNKRLSDSEVNRLSKELLKLNKVSFEDADTYAIELGEILASIFNEKITADILPDGRMYYNIAERILNNTLHNNHKLISEYAVDVQTTLNNQAGLKLKGMQAELNQSRIDGMIERLSNETDFEKIKWMLGEPTINFSQAVVDETVKTNVDFHYKMGLKPKVVRKVEFNGCSWCKAMEGEYEYPDVPEDVYKRHRDCRCVVSYEPSESKKQNVWSKAWVDPEKEAKIEARKKIGL